MEKNNNRTPARRPQKRPPKRKTGTNLFFAAVFVLLGIYVVGYIYNHVLRDDVDQVRIEAAYMDIAASFAGVIIRDEVVEFATRSGEIVFHVEQHTRVRRGHAVASIRDSVAASYLNDLANIEQEAILRAQAGSVANQGEINLHNSQILAILNSAEFGENADISALQELGARIGNEIARRNELYFAGDFELAGQRATAVANFSGASVNISAQTPGIVSIYMDGLEEVLTPANLTNIPISTIQGNRQNFAAERNIFQGDGAFRIIRTNDWYIAAHIPRVYAQNWTTQTNITIFVNQPDGILPLNVEVYRLVDQGLDFYAVFRTNFETLRFIDQRNISFQLRQNPAQGLRLPRSAIVERSIFPIPLDFARDEYEMMVAVLDSGRTVPISGWISNEGNEFYVLADGSNLRVGDIIVSGDENFTIEFIEVVQGVFVSNRGHALFRQIYLPQNFHADADYIVLDPEENPHIRLFDWIVRDGGNVENRLLLN
ncbi:MAG: hypothetical protein LBE35_10565 [Clostridiales bacterium]|nr:hypothetical protein [Clostridiales bacterium]